MSILYLIQGVELGPLEITINSLSKSIESTQQDIAHLQLLWLREQGELVRLSKESDKSHEDVNLLKKKISILSQKKIRIESKFAFSWSLIRSGSRVYPVYPWIQSIY